MGGKFGDLEKFPDFANATPITIDLRPGETLFIPCAWAHLVEYIGPSMSVSALITPDENILIQDMSPDWAPTMCSDFYEAGRRKLLKQLSENTPRAKPFTLGAF